MKTRIAAVLILALSALMHMSSTAEGAQPYGGCKEAIQAPHSQGADWCRKHGWTVTRHIVVTPNKRVATFRKLPACAYEDGSGGTLPCRWNFGPGTQGSGVGRAYWINKNGKTHYVQR